MGYIDYKVTQWWRIELGDNVDTKEFVSKLDPSEIKRSYDLRDKLEEELEPEAYDESQPLDDTYTDMDVEENGGFPTIEIYDGNHVLLWDNVKGKQWE